LGSVRRGANLYSDSMIALDITGRLPRIRWYNQFITIYVTNMAYPSITFYAANPSGTLNETPLEEILGIDARLNVPVGIAVH
jgi:hypothetical protein